MNLALNGKPEAMIHRAVSAALLLWSVALPASAQVPTSMPMVDSGLVVRAWLDSGQLRGRLLQPMRADADSVRYCRFPGPPCDGVFPASQVAWFQVDRVQHLDVQVGNRWKKGAWIGGVVGGLLAGFAIAVNDGFCDSRRCKLDTIDRLFATGLGIVSNAAWGALIGSAFPRFERRF
ncbi:MAG: hypothetical protein ABIR59_09955 [Gemmatimonadales bacterium]